MFEIGFTELLLIAVVALVVLGPQRLPVVARAAGHLIGRFQRYANQVKSDISREMQLDELRAMQAEVQKTASDIERTIRTEVDDLEMRAKAQAAELEQATQEAGQAASQAASHTVERAITQEVKHEVQHFVAPAASARELAAAADAAESQFDEIQAAISRVMESAPPGVLNPAPAVAAAAPAPAPATPALAALASKPERPEAAPPTEPTHSPSVAHTTPAPVPVDDSQLALFADPLVPPSKPTR